MVGTFRVLDYIFGTFTTARTGLSPFWLFVANHCQGDGTPPHLFDVDGLREKIGWQDSVVLVTFVESKCRIESAWMRWLPCASYKEDQVREPDEDGLERLRLAIA